MRFIRGKKGNIIGKFDDRKTRFIGTNYRKGGTMNQWDELLCTPKGNYILWHLPSLEETEDCEIISYSTAIELMELWGYDEDTIREHFPNYKPQETV